MSVHVTYYPEAGVAAYPLDDIRIHPFLEGYYSEQVPEGVGHERFDTSPFAGRLSGGKPASRRSLVQIQPRYHLEVLEPSIHRAFSYL